MIMRGATGIGITAPRLIPGLTTDARGAHCWTVAVRPGISERTLRVYKLNLASLVIEPHWSLS
jgi:hypothetical protein